MQAPRAVPSREALTVARAVDFRALKEQAEKQGGTPKIESHLWIDSGRNADEIETRDQPPYRNPPPYDAALAAAVMRERREMLLRFRGTPFGEQIAFNGVYTWRPGIYVWTPGTEGGKTPGESSDPGVGTGPAGGSTGSVPATGR